jgi:hypothetical protein
VIQSYDFVIYNFNASVVVGKSDFWTEKMIFVFLKRTRLKLPIVGLAPDLS